jgi:Zn-dependent peptidase ImmA (M78 family)
MKNRFNIIKEADKFRTENGLGASEPLKIKSLLLKLNVQSFFLPLEENISGMSVKTGDFRFMLINSKHSIGRQNFSILHECYHLFIQKDFSSMICSAGQFDEKDKTELKADWFAAFVLMPECGIIERIPESELGKNKISLPSLLFLEHYFSCSRSALLHRLYEMNLINEEFQSEFKRNIRTTARLYGYETKLYEPGRENMFIGDYGLLAKELLDKDLISESHFINLLQDIGIQINFEDMDIDSK